MRILPMTNPEEVQAVARRIWEQHFERPEARAIMEKLIADPRVDREGLFYSAFNMGVIAGLYQMLQGRVVSLEQPEPYSDS